MNNNDYDLIALLQKVPTATVSLQLSDLDTFSRRLIAQTREEYEREITWRLEARNEVYLTSDTVKQTLKVGNTTLLIFKNLFLISPKSRQKSKRKIAIV